MPVMTAMTVMIVMTLMANQLPLSMKIHLVSTYLLDLIAMSLQATSNSLFKLRGTGDYRWETALVSVCHPFYKK